MDGYVLSHYLQAHDRAILLPRHQKELDDKHHLQAIRLSISHEIGFNRYAEQSSAGGSSTQCQRASISSCIQDADPTHVQVDAPLWDTL